MNLTLLFDVDSRRIAKVEKISSRVRSSHTFGGSLSDLGYSLTGTAGRVHLLYRFDQDDDLVPRVLPNARHLPLCYGFYCVEYNSGDLLTAYRVNSDREIELLSPNGLWTQDVGFYDDYPMHFPLQRVKLKSMKHNFDNARGALTYSAIFSLDDLPSSVRQSALELARPKHQKLLDYGETDLELEDFLRNYSQPFAQGLPNDVCIYDGCPNGGTNRMKTIAVVQGHPTNNARLWSDTDDDPGVQLVFRQCLGCCTIYGTQQAG